MDNNSFFVLDASNGLLRRVGGESEAYRFTLRDTSTEGMYFSDRPERDSGRLGSSRIVSIIEKELKLGDGANFALSYVNSRGVEGIEVFSLGKIRINRNGDKITGLATLLQEELGAGDFLTSYKNASEGNVSRNILDTTVVFTPAGSETEPSSPTITTKQEPVKFDFGLSTASGEIKKIPGEENAYQIKAKVISGNVAYLSEYPFRETGLIPVEDFVFNWQSYGFDRVLPNASIYIPSQDSALHPDLSQAITIADIRYNEARNIARLRFEPLGPSKSSSGLKRLLAGSSSTGKEFTSSFIFIDSASYMYALDPAQSANFNAGAMLPFGLVNSLSIGGVNYAQDLNASFSLAGQGGVGVSGFLESINWSGSAMDPISATLLVSNASQVNAISLVNSVISDASLSIDFSVFKYDPVLKEYYQAFASVGSISGEILVANGAYGITIAGVRSSLIASPNVYALTVAFSPAPGAAPGQISVASSANGSRNVQWGS